MVVVAFLAATCNLRLKPAITTTTLLLCDLVIRESCAQTTITTTSDVRRATCDCDIITNHHKSIDHVRPLFHSDHSHTIIFSKQKSAHTQWTLRSL